MSNTTVSVLIGAIFLVIVLFDIVLALDGKKGNTISERARWLGRYWPPSRLIISFGMGALSAHFWGW